MQRKASAVWMGGLKEGKGRISTESKLLKEAPYSFCTRFENGKGTNPEELLAAAHAACFTMAVSAELGSVSIIPDKLETAAAVTIEKVQNGFAITKVHLELMAHIPGVDQSEFDAAVMRAKNGCPVSKLFKAGITLSYRLV